MLDKIERRGARDPEIKVWDRFVRSGHWLLVLAFGTLYWGLHHFPLHAYAGYLITILVAFRIVWGLVGSRYARFSSFLFGPADLLLYARQAMRGQAPYFASHNPMGAAMVYALLALLLANGLVGIMLGGVMMQIGPLAERLPAEWMESLYSAHKYLGDAITALVLVHMLGVLWAAWLHRENYVYAMFTGVKRVPRAEGRADAKPEAQ
jgi:cytochrome b